MEKNYNSQENLSKRYIEEEIECETKNIPQKEIYEYLGSFAAEAEWNTNPDEANKRFLNISAYKKFRDDYYIGLVGRTGTGKTSIIKKTLNDIQNNTNSFFRHGLELSLGDYITNLPNYANIDSSTKSIKDLEKNLKIILILVLCVMSVIIKMILEIIGIRI